MDKLTRQCAICANVKPVWDFPLNSRMESGRDVRCRSCVDEHMAKFGRKLRVKKGMV